MYDWRIRFTLLAISISILQPAAAQTLPPLTVEGKTFFFETFFRANWYKANEFCRFHGMQLASITSELQSQALDDLLRETGLNTTAFWTSGNDLAQPDDFTWFSNGQSFLYKNWQVDNPDHAIWPDGEVEHCVNMYDIDGSGVKWNDSRCSNNFFFVCEI